MVTPEPGAGLGPQPGASEIGGDSLGQILADESRYDPPRLSVWGRTRRRFRRWPWIPGFILLFVLVLPALFADFLTPHDPLRGVLADGLQPPAWLEGGTWEYPLGTDKQGRDVLTRLIYGARISLSVSLIAVFVGAFIGTGLGMIAGYFGGKADLVISWLIDSVHSLPGLLFALVLVALFGASFSTVIIVLTVTIWSKFARQIRGDTLSVRESDFVARARVAGASRTWIITKHILPNVANTLIVLATLQIGIVILEESSLSFIGAGIPRPNPSWGVMVADGRDQIVTSWWLSFFPGLAIMLVVLALNLFGDWLRDYLDPRLRQQG